MTPRQVAKLRATERYRTLSVVRREGAARAEDAKQHGNPDAARRIKDLTRDLVARLKALHEVGDEV